MSGRLHAKSKPARPSATTRPGGRTTTTTGTRRVASAAAPKRPTRKQAAPKRPSRSTAKVRSAPKVRSTAKVRTAPARRPAATTKARTPAVRPAPTGPARRPSAVRTPAERAAIRTRRNRVRLAVAGIVALVVLVTSFPLTVLLGQHHQLSAASAQLSELRHENALLSEQQQQLNSNAEVKRLAQQNYQLVQPGRSLFVILPPAGQSVAAPGAPTAGDPADQPLVSPAQAPNMSPDPGLPQTPVATGAMAPTAGTATGAARPAAGFWSRITGSLEFWK